MTMTMTKRTEAADPTTSATSGSKPARKFCAYLGGCNVQIRPCDEFCRDHQREGHRAKAIAASQARMNPVAAQRIAARENLLAVVAAWHIGQDLPEGLTVTKQGERQLVIRFPGGSVTHYMPKH